MQREGDEAHFDTDEARAASTPNIVRWVLIISLLAAIVLLSAIWIFGAVATHDERAAHVADRSAEQQDTVGSGTDSIVSERADELEAPSAAGTEDVGEIEN